nr:spore germination protein [Bacillus sp. OV166]
MFISPKGASKNTQGSGSINTGFHVTTITGQSTTTSVNADVLDQPIVQDN